MKQKLTFQGSKYGLDDIVSISKDSVAMRVPEDCPLGQTDVTPDCIGCEHEQPCLVPIFGGVNWQEIASDLADSLDDTIEDVHSSGLRCEARAALHKYNTAMRRQHV